MSQTKSRLGVPPEMGSHILLVTRQFTPSLPSQGFPQPKSTTTMPRLTSSVTFARALTAPSGDLTSTIDPSLMPFTEASSEQSMTRGEGYNLFRKSRFRNLVCTYSYGFRLVPWKG